MTNIKKNKDVLKKVIASTITWVMLSSIAMQGVNAMSFNIEGLDMKVSQPTTVVQWGWWSWVWNWWSVEAQKMIIDYKIQRTAQMDFTQKLAAAWKKFMLIDVNWDWKDDVVVYKIAPWKQFDTVNGWYLSEITIYLFDNWVYQAVRTLNKVWDKNLSDFYVKLKKIKNWNKTDVLFYWYQKKSLWSNELFGSAFWYNFWEKKVTENLNSKLLKNEFETTWNNYPKNLYSIKWNCEVSFPKWKEVKFNRNLNNDSPIYSTNDYIKLKCDWKKIDLSWKIYSKLD